MKTTIRRILALLLAVLTLSSLSIAAQADGRSRYPADQYFVKDESQTKGFAVQVSASTNYSGSCKNRDKMLEMGYDCFVYDIDGQFRVMCGKFLNVDDANHYKEVICSNTERKNAYVTNVYLPSWAYTEFEEIFRTDPNNNSGGDYIPWEQPTGPFYDGDRAATTVPVYTVQFSAGTSFHGSEQHRDDMIAQGFDAFVYKKDGKYRTMSGMFQTKREAEERCKAIKTYTDQSDAFVTVVDIPTSYVNYNTEQDQSIYYGYYRDLLYNFNWARGYLTVDEADYAIQNGPYAQEYLYYVCDIDRNGVDELIIVEAVTVTEGIWVVFSCNRNGPYLAAKGDTYGLPRVLVCQDKGILALQAYYRGVGVCDVYYFRNGSMTGHRNATVRSTSPIDVPPTDADPNADGYYMLLSGYQVTDLHRLGGGGQQYPAPYQSPAPAPVQPTPAPALPVPTPAPDSGKGGYTHDSVVAAARAAAQGSSDYDTVSNEGTELQVPSTSQFFDKPFTMTINAERSGRAIYIMPVPEAGHGYLGKIKHGETVTILSESNGFYFFVAADGRAGWNGKKYFR